MTTEITTSAPTTGTRTWYALGAVVFTVLAWASAFVVIRWVGKDFDPGPLTLGRLLIGTLALGVLLAARRTWVQPTGREWALLLLCGLCWFGIYNIALNAAEQRIDAGTAAMLVNLGPILIAVLAGTILGEGFPRWLVIGGAVAFCGALLIGAASANADHADLTGLALTLLAALTYAIGVIAQKPVLRRLPALQVTWLACAIASVACLPFTPALLSEIQDAPARPLAGLVYLGIVPTAIAFSTWAYALARMDAGRLGVSTYLVPPLTIAVAWMFLGEVPALLALVGGVVCLAGVALSRRR
jgi:drug/metabolite transporter (DMT)-like permease